MCITAELVPTVSTRLESIGVTSNSYPEKRVGQTSSNRHIILAYCASLHVNKEQTQLEVALVIPDKYYLYHLLSGTVPIHGTDRNEFTRYLGRDKHNVGAKCTPYTVITKSVITPGP